MQITKHTQKFLFHLPQFLKALLVINKIIQKHTFHLNMIYLIRFTILKVKIFIRFYTILKQIHIFEFFKKRKSECISLVGRTNQIKRKKDYQKPIHHSNLPNQNPMTWFTLLHTISNFIMHESIPLCTFVDLFHLPQTNYHIYLLVLSL